MSPVVHNDTINEITPYMYLSGFDSLTGAKLRELGVTCVVNAMGTEHSLGCSDNVELGVKTILAFS